MRAAMGAASGPAGHGGRTDPLNHHGRFFCKSGIRSSLKRFCNVQSRPIELILCRTCFVLAWLIALRGIRDLVSHKPARMQLWGNAPPI